MIAFNFKIHLNVSSVDFLVNIRTELSFGPLPDNNVNVLGNVELVRLELTPAIVSSSSNVSLSNFPQISMLKSVSFCSGIF